MIRYLHALLQRYRSVNWALADQAMVSGCNFLSGVVLARWLGIEQFGVYVLLYAGLLYVNSIQGALIVQPMLSRAPSLEKTERDAFLARSLASQLILTFCIASAVLLVGWGIHYWQHGEFAHQLSVPMMLCFSMAVFSFQLQEWFRRHCFANEQAALAFISDAFAYGGFLTLVCGLGWFDMLTVNRVFQVVMLASGLGALFVFVKSIVRPDFHALVGTLRDGWLHGKHYLGAWQLQWFGSQGVLMMSAGVLGAHAAGGVRAASNIAGPINILYLAMENILPVAAAKNFAAHGRKGLGQYLWKITLLGTLLLLPVLAVLSWLAEPLVVWLYGESFRASAILVPWYALTIFLQFYLRQQFFWVRTIGESRWLLYAGITMAIAPVVVAYLTVTEFRELGIMWAGLASVIAGLLTMSVAYVRLRVSH